MSITPNVDSELRHYSSKYDALNRFKNSYYAENERYNSKFNTSVYQYDRNGNILRLNRRMANPSNTNLSTSIDNLYYTYDTGNKLMKVRDSYSYQTYGDEGFKDGNKTANDYEYDFNGNMTKDKNKGITNIKYNHLNLPTSVVFNKGNVYGNNKIAYIYDATGVKLRKTVTEYPENTSAKKIVRTNYEGAYITKHNFNYSRNGQFWSGNDFYSGIQFISHPEGYIEPNNQGGSGGFDYVYQYKDHLGNIRLSYKDKDGDNSITGGSESIFYDDIENAGQTQSGWESIGSIHPSAAQYDNTKSLSGNYSVKIQKSSKGNFFIHSNSWLDIDPENAEYIISGWIYTEGSGTVWGDLVLFMHEAGETGYFTDVAHTERVYTKGKWVYVERKVAVPNNIVKLNVRISMNSSAGGTVYFDNLSIRKVNPEQDIEIVEENNYYPFGLQHKGYNNVVNGSENNYFTYNGKELEESLDLNVIEMDWRQYDPAIGRFNVVDPMAEFMYNHTPYHFSYNDPISFSDPTGLCPDGSDDCDEDAINEDDPIELDTVIVNAPSGNSNNSSSISFSGRMPHFLRYGEQPVTWDSPYEPGTLDQYNKDWGTNYTNDNSWNQWYYDNHWKPQFDDQRSSIHNATAEMAEFLSYFIPTSGGTMAVAASLPKLLKGAKVANAITKSIGIKFSVRADGAYNLGKRFIIDNLANQVSSSSMATKRILINLGGNKFKPTITRMYYHDYQMFNTKQVFETTEFMLKHGSKLVK